MELHIVEKKQPAATLSAASPAPARLASQLTRPGLGAETSMSAQKVAAPASLTLTAGISMDHTTALAW